MSALKLHTLKQKLWAIVAASFVARVIMFFALPNTPSSLAPDEGTYGLVSSWAANEILPEQLFFYQNLYFTGRSLLLPSSFLVKLGIDGLSSVRLVSSMYGLLSLILFVIIISHFRSNSKIHEGRQFASEKAIVTLVFVFAFLPSHFLWSILGLRESTNEFWLILVFVFTYLFFKDVDRQVLFFLTILTIAIILVFSTRPQVGLLVIVSLILYSLTQLKNPKTYLFIPAVIVGMMGGNLLTTPTIYFSENAFTAVEVFPPTKDSSPTPTKDSSPTPTKDSSPTPTKDSSPTPTSQSSISKLCNFVGQELASTGKNFVCEKTKTPMPKQEASMPKVDLVETVSTLSEGQKARQVGAASQIPVLYCPLSELNKFSSYVCVIWRAPYATLTFLFRPLPILDTTSTSSMFASIENVVWIFGIGLLLYLLIVKRRYWFKPQVLPPVIFLVLYTVGAGSYEGNMGTAFRHKSLILWIILFIYAVCLCTQEDAMESRGNNSQESAV
jgi:hypothetical protein